MATDSQRTAPTRIARSVGTAQTNILDMGAPSDRGTSKIQQIGEKVPSQGRFSPLSWILLPEHPSRRTPSSPAPAPPTLRGIGFSTGILVVAYLFNWLITRDRVDKYAMEMRHKWGNFRGSVKNLCRLIPDPYLGSFDIKSHWRNLDIAEYIKALVDTAYMGDVTYGYTAQDIAREAELPPLSRRQGT